jgi:predicted ArsR family transcriptional regulator
MISKTMPSDTRKQILELLKKQGPLTAEALGKVLKITSMGARQRLLALERDGLVEHKVEPRPAGRPGYVYSLTSAGDELFPRTYPQMANTLLELVRRIYGEGGIDTLIHVRTKQLIAQYRARLIQKDLEHRVKELAAIRTEEGYMADYEKIGKNTFRLREHNCAVCQVAANCKQLCTDELELFKRALPDAEITRETHILSRDRNCTYLIRRKPGAREPLLRP